MHDLINHGYIPHDIQDLQAAVRKRHSGDTKIGSQEIDKQTLQTSKLSQEKTQRKSFFSQELVSSILLNHWETDHSHVYHMVRPLFTKMKKLAKIQHFKYHKLWYRPS